MNLKSIPKTFPVGKLPPAYLARLLAKTPLLDNRILVGPGIGLDCAVVDLGSHLLVFKSDPITFATDEIGWYAVQVNVNDIATTGATPRWFLMTLLLPEHHTTLDLIDTISNQVFTACQEIGVSVIGGHTEITHGLDRSILIGTVIGEVNHQDLITPEGARPGDSLLITKGVPVEATAILAREFPTELLESLTADEIAQAQDFLYQPGINILKEADLVTRTGKITAMHDPTEGGLASALWELAEACQHTIVFKPDLVPVPELAGRVCQNFEIDPFGAIASGALLVCTPPSEASNICRIVEGEGITCTEIGRLEEGPAQVWSESGKDRRLFPRPERDEIARVYAAHS